MSGQGLSASHVIGAVGVTSLCISAYLFGALQRSKTELSTEVERSVRTGIQEGAAEVLAPEKIEDRSAAVGRGLVDGMIEGAIDKATDQETRRFGRDAAEVMVKEADAVAGLGLEMLGAALAPVEPRDAERATETETERPAKAEGDPSGVEAKRAPNSNTGARRRADLVNDAAEVTGEAMDLGFDVLDAMLRAPRKRPENDEEPRAHD